ELPNQGRFRVTVTAAKYDDGLLLDRGARAQGEHEHAIVWRDAESPQSIDIKTAGVYQVDIYKASGEHTNKSDEAEAKPNDAAKNEPDKSRDVALELGDRLFTGKFEQPAFL